MALTGFMSKERFLSKIPVHVPITESVAGNHVCVWLNQARPIRGDGETAKKFTVNNYYFQKESNEYLPPDVMYTQ